MDMKASRLSSTRPGGRSTEVGLRVQKAVCTLLEADGYAGVSYQTVSELAEVGRATLYRRWPTRPELTLFGISGAVASTVAIATNGDLEQDLRDTLCNIARFIATRLGRASIAAIIEMEEPGDLHKALWAGRASEVNALFARALAREEMDAATDAEAIFAMAAGSLYFRNIVAGAPVDDRWIDRVVSNSLILLRRVPTHP